MYWPFFLLVVMRRNDDVDVEVPTPDPCMYEAIGINMKSVRDG